MAEPQTSENTFEIRMLLEEDAAEWWRLRYESLVNEPQAFGKSVEEHEATPVEMIARRFREAPARDAHWGVFQSGKLIGMATFIRDTGAKDGHKGRIYGVYVDPAHRGRGIGRAVLTQLLERAGSDSSLEQILLAVAVGQSSARRLYRELGFSVYGTEPRALKVGSVYVDEDYMVMQLCSG